ncbi:MAG: FAD-dependent oxidoreductase [Burkholderia sp.]|nr:FAD-dependent oxidoreductase [Burkholderia sp.]
MNLHLSSTDRQPLRIVIVGAGVAGCIVARTLAQCPGVAVTCLERVSRDDHSEAGTGLNIGPNAIKLLRAHDPALADAVAAASLPWKSWRTSLTDGTELFTLPLADVADNDGVRIRWSELYRVLRDGAGDAVRYGVTVSGIAREADGRCTLGYKAETDGETVTLRDIDLLIGADGRYSDTRRALSGAPVMRQVGVAIFRLLVPDTSAGLIDDYEQWFNGPNRLLAFRVPPGHIYMAGTFPLNAGAEISDADKSAEALRRYYTPAGAVPGAQCAWLVDTLCANAGAIHWARLQETEAGYRDGDAPLLYLGDAAHGMVPTLGQGATQAIEDGCVAAALIASRLEAGNRDVNEWLRAFDAARSERIRFVMDFSLEASDTLFAGSDPVAGSLKKVQPAFRAKLSRLYRDVGHADAMKAAL